MNRRSLPVIGASVFLVALCLAACTPTPEPPAAVTTARIAADTEPHNWLSHGRTYSEQRFSPLTQINVDNVEALGLAWYLDLGTNRGLEATPLVVDGVMYVSGAWNLVHAIDAATGELIWRYDPEVSRPWVAAHACCDAVSRGVAVAAGKVLAATLDGRLLALDAMSGSLLWETLTIDQDKPYTITGAPRVVNGKVLIGNSGADYGVRGYLSAYDVASGALAWRFYTVPGDPARPQESAALERALATWGRRGQSKNAPHFYSDPIPSPWVITGGGGTVWNSMAYDPELNLVYFGTGNGTPWSREQRSPGGGDNLYLSSVIAVDADTGAYAWHYQTTYAYLMAIEPCQSAVAVWGLGVKIRSPVRYFQSMRQKETVFAARG